MNEHAASSDDSQARPHESYALPERAPIAIVGAGLSGLAIATALGETARQAVLIEAARAGGTCTAALGTVRVGPGMHLARLAAGHGEALAAACVAAGVHNRALLEELVRAAPEVDWEPGGALRLARDDDEAEELQRSAALLRAMGRRVRCGPAAAFLPGAPAGFVHAALHEDDGVLDPAVLVEVLQRRARARGARLFESTRVQRLEDDGDVRLLTTGGTVRAEIAVVATDAALPQLVPFCRFKILPMRAQALAAVPADRGMAQAQEPRHAEPRAWFAAQGYEMWCLQRDGGVQVCGSRHLPVQRELGARDGTSDDVQALLEENLREFRRFASHRIARRWSGVQGVSCDGLPLVGVVPGRPRLVVCGGFGMNGLGWAFVAAQVVAQLIRHGRAEHTAPFSPRRFL